MKEHRLRPTDILITIYLLVVATYCLAAIQFLLGSTIGFRRSANVVMAFASTFAAYTLASVCLAAWLYRDVLQRFPNHNSIWWLLGFLFLGGITIPTYYFLQRTALRTEAGKPNTFEWFARALVSVLLLVASFHMAWALTLALGHLPITPHYRFLSAANRMLTWLGWLATAVVLVRRPWPVARKLGWAAASLLGMFLVMPIFHFAYPENVEPASPNSR